MAREMIAMWRTANGLVGVPGQMSHQTSDATWNPADTRARGSAGSKSNWRSWIPNLERTPPLLQFMVRLGRWIKARCQSAVPQTPQLRLVGQLALGTKRHLSLVEVGGIQFLVGGGVDHVTVIVPISTSGTALPENLHSAGRPQQL
jgi:hypothetical protein